MKWQTIETNWEEYKDSAKLTWSRLHDAELELVAGRRDKLIDKVRDCYHLPQEEAEIEVDAWAMSQSGK